MPLRSVTRYFVLHTSATRALMDIGATDIDRWHRERGWSGIGYHYVIRRDGTLEKGRAINQVGAHVAGHNHYSIGICLVGGLANSAPFAPENNYTTAQWVTLRKLLTELQRKYPRAKVLGHRDFPRVAKACPCFDARAWAAANGFRAAPRLRPPTREMAAAAATGMGAGGMDSGAEAIAGMPGWLGEVLTPAQSLLYNLESLFTWASYGLTAIAIVTGGIGVYNGVRSAWEYWRTRDDPVTADEMDQ